MPLECDLVFDVRFLQNPYYVPELRRLSGLAGRASAPTSSTSRWHAGSWPPWRSSWTSTLPAYLAEGKTRLTIGIGCTGGFHRSIALAEEIGAWLEARGHGAVSVFHRELERG